MQSSMINYSSIIKSSKQNLKTCNQADAIRFAVDCFSSLAKDKIFSDAMFVLDEKQSNEENYDIDIKLICSIIDTTKDNIMYIISRDLPQLNEYGGKFYGDDKLINCISSFCEKKDNKIHIAMIGKNTEASGGIKMDEGRSNKFYQNIYLKYKGQTTFYTINNKLLDSEFDERFMVVGNAFKYVKSQFHTIISYDNPKIAQQLITKFHAITNIEDIEKFL